MKEIFFYFTSHFNYIREFLVSQIKNDSFSYNKAMNIGKMIKELRLERGWSQTKLADELFVSQDTISLWELGKSLPDILNLIKLAKLFKVSTDYLLGLVD